MTMMKKKKDERRYPILALNVYIASLHSVPTHAIYARYRQCVENGMKLLVISGW